jgi:ferredoxin
MQKGDDVEFDRAKLQTYGLSMYLTTPCNCRAERYRVVSVQYANGKQQYRLQCAACERLCGGAILHGKVVPFMVAAVFLSNVDPANKCERCGQCSNGVELHHWAPFAKFNDFDQWPTSMLCSACHVEWHSKMNGYVWRPNLRRSSSR